jgi:predicted RNase H-like HicB family nuclease
MKTYRFSIVIEKNEEGYFAFCPELQGCYTQGDTYEEVLENIKDAIRLHVNEAQSVSLTSLEVAV